LSPIPAGFSPSIGLVPTEGTTMQTAHSNEWRPGFAKRADNFDEVCAQAEAWRWRPGDSIARVAAAVLKGTPTLTTPQRLTLLLYVEHLNQDRLEQDIACVWPSTGLIAEYLGCSESQARTNRRGLEAAGFMVRDYNRANRPAGLEAYDLRPLMARLDEMEAVDAAIREAAATRRALYAEAVAFPTKYSAQAPGFRRLEQSQKNFSYPVPETDAGSPRSHTQTRPAPRSASGKAQGASPQPQRSGTVSAIGSPGGASGFASVSPGPSVHAEMVRQELQSAVRICPRLATLLPEHVLKDPSTATPEDAARIAAAAPLLLPEPERNNSLSVQWGWARHGIRVVTMLAIAIEDPEVRSPCAYFGAFATKPRGGVPDLRPNLARILKQKGDIPPAEAAPPPAEPVPLPLMFRPGVEDPPWPEIDAELYRLIKMGAHGSWFGQVGFHGIADGVITLSTATSLAADHIKRNYIPAVLQAAENVGVFVDRVMLTVRKR
jgi:hypothetical protein